MNFTLGIGDKKVKRYIKLRQDMVPKCMRMFMTEVYRDITIATPVRTGRARYGWNCTIKTPNLSAPPEGDYSLDLTKATTVFTAKAVTGKDTLYISNSVPYIGHLNNGGSRQAAARFVQTSFVNGVQKLHDYIKIKGYDIGA